MKRLLIFKENFKNIKKIFLKVNKLCERKQDWVENNH